jgi:hypothetical protein
MAANSSIVLEGVLKSDGTLEFWSPPAFPPGPVRVTLEALTEANDKAGLLPDPPSRDESIPAPFDLPLANPAEPVDPCEVVELLPEPFAWTEEDARP